MAAPSLTCPGLVAAVQGTDPVGDLLATHFPGTGRAPQLSVEQVSMDTEGLSKLVVSFINSIPCILLTLGVHTEVRMPEFSSGAHWKVSFSSWAGNWPSWAAYYTHS